MYLYIFNSRERVKDREREKYRKREKDSERARLATIFRICQGFFELVPFTIVRCFYPQPRLYHL